MSEKKLSDPITRDEIEWRIDRKAGSNTVILPYITSRCVMDRLDAEYGPEDWSTRVQMLDGGALVSIILHRIVDGKVIEVVKTDGAETNKIAPIKGTISDAMKRAAVQCGIGRDLYNYPRMLLQGEHKYIPDWALERLHDMTDVINSGDKDLPPSITLTNNK